MRRIQLALLSLFIASAVAKAQVQQNHLFMEYTGLEEMCVIKNGKKECFKDPENPAYKWYHKAVYRIITTSDSVFLELSPLFIDKGDTVHSASDGGYYYFKGSYTLKGNIYTFNLLPAFCEYCDKKDFLPRKIIAKRTENGLMIKARRYPRSQ